MGVFLAFSVILTIVALSILFRLTERIEDENRMIERSLETSRIYNKAIHQRIEEIRRFRHDAAGILQVVEAYGFNEGEGLNGYIETKQASGEMPKNAMPLLDAILELKKRQCGEADIKFDCPEGFVGELEQSVDETDLCLLVQNLLDNAYEANLRIKEKGQRYMKFTVSLDTSAIITIEVTNRIDSGEKLSFISLKKRPELHGIGLRIVDDILKKYNGSRSVSSDHTNHIVCTTVRLVISH